MRPRPATPARASSGRGRGHDSNNRVGREGDTLGRLAPARASGSCRGGGGSAAAGEEEERGGKEEVGSGGASGRPAMAVVARGSPTGRKREERGENPSLIPC